MAITQLFGHYLSSDPTRLAVSESNFEKYVESIYREKSKLFDLGWNGVYIKRIIDLYGTESEIKICNDFIDCPTELEVYGEFLEKPRCINSDEILKKYPQLLRINFSEILKNLPNELNDINVLLGSDFIEPPNILFLDSWNALISFYEQAFNHQYSVVSWWD